LLVSVTLRRIVSRPTLLRADVPSRLPGPGSTVRPV